MFILINAFIIALITLRIDTLNMLIIITLIILWINPLNMLIMITLITLIFKSSIVSGGSSWSIGVLRDFFSKSY